MKEKFLKAISSELRLLRIENDDLQEDLARKSGVAASTISKYEAGDQNINIIKLEQIIKPYNLNLYIFFTRVLAKTQKEKEEV